MNKTVTFLPDKNYLENRSHGDTAFPVAYYRATQNPFGCPWHWHEEFECSIVREGQASYHVGTDHLLLKAGDGLFINTGTLHASIPMPLSCVSVTDTLVFHGRLIYGSKYTVFWQNYIRPIAAAALTLPYLHLSASVAWEKEILDLIAEVSDAAREKEFGYEFVVREKLTRIFLVIFKNQSSISELIQNESSQELQHLKTMIRYIQNNYSEPLMIEDLARSASISEREVQRSFRNVIQQSPIQYLIRYRIEKACYMLDSGEESIIDICNSCGFSSPSYFAKTFKSIVGCTPREYRKSR